MEIQNSKPSFPFLRFSLRYWMSKGELAGPRISYIQSINLIEKGEGLMEYEDKTVKLYPGVQIFLPSGKKHKWVSSKVDPVVFSCAFFEWNYTYRPNIKLRNDYLPEMNTHIISEYIEPQSELDIPSYLVLNNTEKWLSLFNSTISNIDVLDVLHFPDYLKLQGQFGIFLDYVLKNSSQSKALPDPRIKKFIKQLEDANFLFSNKNVAQWAEEIGVSRSYFHYLFKLQTGTTPNVYQNSVRINKTITDLIHSNITITEISERHGFESVHYYSKLFRKLIGQTPSEYRNKYKIFGL